MGEYATTTKPDEHSSRPHVRDLFKNQSRIPDEKQENDNENISDENTTQLWTLYSFFLFFFLYFIRLSPCSFTEIWIIKQY